MGLASIDLGGNSKVVGISNFFRFNGISGAHLRRGFMALRRFPLP